MLIRLTFSCVIALTAALVVFFLWSPQQENLVLRLGSTTSTKDSGLLDHLIPLYEAQTGVEIVVVAKGTGAAIRDGMSGQVDALLVHNKAREEALVAEGFALSRLPVMSNDFLIVGAKRTAPYDDLSNLIGDLVTGNLGLFLSRGDESGTHAAEQRLWARHGLNPQTFGRWYATTGTGMGQTLITANLNGAATLVDSATWLRHKDRNALHIWYDSRAHPRQIGLQNPYGYLALNSDKIPSVNSDLAQDFGRWLAGAAGQRAIAAYLIDGRQVFVPHLTID